MLVAAEYKKMGKLAGERDMWRRNIDEATARCGVSRHGRRRRRRKKG
jgi:hypothetical protein